MNALVSALLGLLILPGALLQAQTPTPKRAEGATAGQQPKRKKPPEPQGAERALPPEARRQPGNGRRPARERPRPKFAAPPKPKGPRNFGPGASSIFMAALAGTRPRRLAMGQSGTLQIVLSLRSDAVMLPESRFHVAYDRQQGAIGLDGWTRAPAAVGTIYERFRDRAIYDNTAMLRIPINVAGGTAFGTYTVQVEVEADLHDGKTGEPLYEFKHAIPCQIVVGDRLPSPTPIIPSLDEKEAGPGEPVSDARGIELQPIDGVELPAGARRAVRVRLTIPDGLYLSRDPELEVPALSLEGLGDGLRYELGEESAVERTPDGGVYRGSYEREVVLIASAAATPGRRRPQVSLRYLSCDESGCYPPATLTQNLEIEIGSGGVTMQPGLSPDGPSGGAGLDGEGAFGGAADGGPAYVLWGLLAIVGLGLGALAVLRARGR